jgi:hypothetical protein
MNTNEILAEAMSLWPSNQAKPSFKMHTPYEWECTSGGDPCGYAQTLEEALYRYAIICQKYDDQFGPILEYLGQFVDDPIL